MLVLSLFPGIGLLDRAFEEEGFCVVRGPDVLWGGDIRRFNPPTGRFDGIIGGPPCQAFSQLAHIVRANGFEPKFGNLIPEYERVVSEAAPKWFVMENVPAAPTPAVEGYEVHSFLLNNRQLGETQNRVRRWSFGYRGEQRILMVETVVFENREYEFAATGDARRRPVALLAGGKPKRGTSRTSSLNRGGGSVGFADMCRLQGLPEDFDIEPFTMTAKRQAVGNGVPLPMGRAIARAVREALNQ